ncbi:inactive serine protease PAMR1 [Rhincodon typus]|uniref:inactive serine protease PAMR1 n=1 Tax=Rhincodon typus TaxID=259920 RepID=UPI00202EAC81|nr:inactive serine protease PAMR1 [Rhincodon typus]
MNSVRLGESCEGEALTIMLRTNLKGERSCSLNRMLAWTVLSLLIIQMPSVLTFPKGYTLINEDCPGAEWNIMCRDCCETDQIECVCPGKDEVVGYSVPCCRNEEDECDSCLIHPGCIIFDNCKGCNNGSWGTLDDFYIKGLYCSECHAGWSGGDCMKCGDVINASRGQIVLEGYPSNSHCEWTVSVNSSFAIELRFSMLSLEFDYMCQYDYVEIRDGDNIDSRVVGKFCGNERPPPIRTTGSSLHILFVSDGYKSFDGFFATFEEVDVCSSSPCLHDGLCVQLGPAYYKCACLAGYTGKWCENMVICRNPMAPVNGTVEGNDFRFGSHIYYSCDADFQLVGSNVATCQLDGNWSMSTPQCESKSCPDPGVPQNGQQKILPRSRKVKTGYATIGTIVQFTCSDSFILSGSAQRRCQQDGTWTGKQPTCTKGNKTCPDPGVPLNGHRRILPRSGRINQGYATVGTILQFTCDYLFLLSGSAQRTCQEDGMWTEKQPICTKVNINCTDPGAPVKGQQKILPGSGEISQGYATVGTTVRFTCSYSFVLSGSARRTCQQDGTWTEKQPTCIKACKQPKLPNLVKQKVLSMQLQTRKTPLHRLFAAIQDKEQSQISPTKIPVHHIGNLPAGFYHPHTQLEYECISPFYRRLGSKKRTCLKTGKWSGRSPTCIPICGKLGNFSLQNLPSMAWAWQAALYHKTARTSNEIVRQQAWFLACSGALLNERNIVIAAHCVTELGKVVMISAADMMVVLGKHYHEEDRQEKSRQYLQIAAIIVHPSYDPVLLDSDIAIIKLMDKAKITDQVQPICLPDVKDLSTMNTQGYVTGWRMQHDANDLAHTNDTIRVGTIEIGDSVQCEQQYEVHGISVSITENMFCARQDLNGFSNICPLETGGVATFPAPDRAGSALTWYLVGLVSWGYENGCSQELFTVYTNVTPFKDWIEKHLK